MHLNKLTRGHRDSTQINKIINEMGNKIETRNPPHQKKSSDPTTKVYTQGSWKSVLNGQFSRQVSDWKLKSGSDKPSKQSHNA